jgi:hypothetical protein
MTPEFPGSGQDFRREGDTRSSCGTCLSSVISGGHHSAGQQCPSTSGCLIPLPLNPALKYQVMIPTILAAARSPAGKATHGAAAEPAFSPVISGGHPSGGQQCLCASACPARPLLSPNPALKYSVIIPEPLAAARCSAGKATHGAAAEPVLPSYRRGESPALSKPPSSQAAIPPLVNSVIGFCLPCLCSRRTPLSDSQS